MQIFFLNNYYTYPVYQSEWLVFETVIRSDKRNPAFVLLLTIISEPVVCKLFGPQALLSFKLVGHRRNNTVRRNV